MIRRLVGLLAILCALGIPATATVNSQNSKSIVLGNGAQTQFAFNFIAVAAAYVTVIFTDASGNQTTLVQGSGASQYQIALNNPLQGAIWGIGGAVTYNPGGTPIATGTTLTIFRTLPLTQAITLQNQSSIAVLGRGAETGLDTGVMQGQQINEAISRALQMNITNQVAPLPLPPAAQLANQGLCGDGTGNNIIACSLAPAGVISSPMAPVVGAASLAAGRTAFGLGSMATENINGGSCGGASLQDDGAGNARVVPATVQDSINQAVLCSAHLTYRIASGPLTYTLAKASSTYFNGFTFTINSSVGISTVTPNASDNFAGVASGTSIAIPQGVTCQITTDAAASAVWRLNCNSSQPSLAANAAASALTITLNAASLPFRNPTLTGGNANWATPAGGLSITIPLNATLGTSSGNVPFRVWIFVAYNGGVPVLGVTTCSNATSIFACAAWETIQKSGIAITGGATLAGTLYTASTVTNDAVRIVGYAEYASGLGTAGTWASGPTTLQICIPPFVCKRPGDLIQMASTTTTTAGTTASATFAVLTTGMTLAITPTSAVNLMRVSHYGEMQNGSAAVSKLQLSRGIVNNAGLFGNLSASSAAGVAAATSAVLFGYDLPATTSGTTYAIQGKTTAGTLADPISGETAVMEIMEIMGALEPANDNGSTSLRMVG